MSVAPTPAEIFSRAAEEGERRLDQSLLELVSTSFIAGFTVVFGVAAFGIVEGIVEPRFGHVAVLAGALAFGVGMVFLVVGRTELFNENFFDPVATAVDSDDWLLWPIARLWVVTLALNLVGGGLFALVFAVEGGLPMAAQSALRSFATDLTGRSLTAELSGAIVGGALVSLLSFLLQAVDYIGERMVITYAVGVLLALGPFDHVVVTMIHLWFGVMYGASVSLLVQAETLVVITAGNLVGGIGLVTFTHVTQAIGAGESGAGRDGDT